MAKPHNTRRRKLYVDSTIQGRVLRRFAAIWLIYHVVLWNALFLYRYFQYRGELMAGAAPLTFVDLYVDFTTKHYAVIVCSLAVLPALLWDVLKLSHRIAGPLVRFQRALSELAAGRRVERIQLRKHDLLVEFQETFNEFLESNGLCKSSRSAAGADPHGHPPNADDADSIQQLADDLREVQQAVAKGPTGQPTPTGVR